MKKLFLLGFGALIMSPLAHAEDQICATVLQDAISPTGVCQTFSTPCDVPASYQAVSSCDDVITGSRIEDASERRYKDKWSVIKDKQLATKLSESNNNTTKRRYSYASGSRSLHPSSVLKAKNAGAFTDYSQFRSFTSKKFDAASLTKRSQYHFRRKAFEHENAKTNKNKAAAEGRQYNPNRKYDSAANITRKRVSEMKENNVFIPQVGVDRRFNIKSYDLENRAWKPLRAEYKPKFRGGTYTPKLTRTYRGKRKAGDIEAELLDMESEE